MTTFYKLKLISMILSYFCLLLLKLIQYSPMHTMTIHLYILKQISEYLYCTQTDNPFHLIIYSMKYRRQIYYHGNE